MRALILLMSLQAVSAFASPVSFKNEVQPVLTKYCVMCHIPGAAQADLVLYPDAWIKMVNAPSTQSPLALIEPGSPEKSYFYLKLINEI